MEKNIIKVCSRHAENTSFLLRWQVTSLCNYKCDFCIQGSEAKLKQASKCWNAHFDHVIQTFGFDQCMSEACVYKKGDGNAVVFLVLYVDDILLIGNNVNMMKDVKAWLFQNFEMKDLGEADYILGIKVKRDRSKRMLALSQEAYIDTVLARFNMQNSKKRSYPVLLDAGWGSGVVEDEKALCCGDRSPADKGACYRGKRSRKRAYS